MSSFATFCTNMKTLGLYLINNNFNSAITIIDLMIDQISASKSCNEDQLNYLQNNLREIQVLIFMGLGNYELYNIYLDLRFYLQYSKIDWGTRLIKRRLESNAVTIDDMGVFYTLPSFCIYLISQNL